MKNARRLDRLTTRKTARQGVFRRLLNVLFRLYNGKVRIPVIPVLRQVVLTTDNTSLLESQPQQKIFAFAFIPHAIQPFILYNTSLNHDKNIPTVVNPHGKNIRYVCGYRCPKLLEWNAEQCVVSMLQRFCYSRLHLYSVQSPIVIIDNENIDTPIYIWNSCIPTPAKKLCHNG